MTYKIDLHTHTYASGHGYSTLQENIDVAVKKGITTIAYTEHGPKLPGGPHIYFFNNLKILPNVVHGVRLLKGIEANIMSIQGDIDCEEKAGHNLDIVLAGLHRVDGGYHPQNMTDDTLAVINTMKSKTVDVITHLGNPIYSIDYEAVVKAAVEFNVALEVNNSSFLSSRPGSEGNCKILLKFAKQYGAYISLGSDAHFCDYIGSLEIATQLVKAYEIDADKILNTSNAVLFDFLNGNGNKIRRHKVK